MSKHRIPTVAQLRQAGFRVEVTHYRRISRPGDQALSEVKMLPPEVVKRPRRWPPSPEEGPFDLNPRGGLTEVEVWAPDPPGVALGRAECSKHDMYNRSRGVEIALGRALKELRQTWGVDAASVVAAGRPRALTMANGETITTHSAGSGEKLHG